jgi:hypothetical protein
MGRHLLLAGVAAEPVFAAAAGVDTQQLAWKHRKQELEAE